MTPMLDHFIFKLINLGTVFPRIPFPVWLCRRAGLKRSLCEIWEAEVKQHLFLVGSNLSMLFSALMQPFSPAVTPCPLPDVWLQTRRGHRFPQTSSLVTPLQSCCSSWLCLASRIDWLVTPLVLHIRFKEVHFPISSHNYLRLNPCNKSLFVIQSDETMNKCTIIQVQK